VGHDGRGRRKRSDRRLRTHAALRTAAGDHHALVERHVIALISQRFAGVVELEQCAVDDNAHLTVGSNGPHVALVQQALIDLGEPVGADGADGGYGPATAAAVSSYKAQRGIVNSSGQIDAVVGKLTIAALDDEIAAADAQVSPCLDDRFVGDSVDLGNVPEPAINALLGVAGIGPLVEVDADGAPSVLLAMESSPEVADAVGGLVGAAVGMFSDNDPEPSRARSSGRCQPSPVRPASSGSRPCRPTSQPGCRTCSRDSRARRCWGSCSPRTGHRARPRAT
jgi:hypothetical protein